MSRRDRWTSPLSPALLSLEPSTGIHSLSAFATDESVNSGYVRERIDGAAVRAGGATNRVCPAQFGHTGTNFRNCDPADEDAAFHCTQSQLDPLEAGPSGSHS